MRWNVAAGRVHEARERERNHRLGKLWRLNPARAAWGLAKGSTRWGQGGVAPLTNSPGERYAAAVGAVQRGSASGSFDIRASL
jgi:hypothetical protein